MKRNGLLPYLPHEMQAVFPPVRPCLVSVRYLIHRTLSIYRTLAPVLLGLLLLPGQAWATQTHGDPEGLVVHQLAHLFFLVAMSIFIFWLRERRLTNISGWRYIQYAAFLLVLWNIDAFMVHLIDEQTEILSIARVEPFRIHIDASDGYRFLGWFYYVAKLDHIWSVPALFMLYFGLRRLDRSQVTDKGRQRP